MKKVWRREFFSDIFWVQDHGWPRQVAGHLEHRGVDYVLYMRLRGRYWEGYIVRGARCLSDLNKKVTCWSCDLLRFHWLRFEDYDLERAQESLAGIFQHRYGYARQLSIISPQIVTLA